MTYFRRFAVLAFLFVAPAAIAQSNYEVFLDTDELEAELIDAPSSGWPSSGFRTGQEGWVRLSFVVTPEGNTADPIIVDSVGGAAFEQAALEVLERYRFEPVAAELPWNVIELRFELRRGREAATSNFLKRYRRIMNHVLEDETEHARNQVDSAIQIGGWNLYEEVMLALMVGRVEGLEGDTTEKLENYVRAITLATRRALDGADRREALSRIFEMQHYLGQYGSALLTMAALRAEPRSAQITEALQPKFDEIQAAVMDTAPLTVRGTLFTPCNCDEGQPLWHYRPLRSEFSFANVSGNVESFEARCRTSRLRGDVQDGGRWSLPDDPAQCEIFVFGADGASFEILEHVTDQTTARNERSNVLDRRN